jgi:hypothetical protein
VKLAPMVDDIGIAVIEHGERGTELDPEHPEACLCGVENYVMCDEPGVESLMIYPAQQTGDVRHPDCTQPDCVDGWWWCDIGDGEFIRQRCSQCERSARRGGTTMMLRGPAKNETRRQRNKRWRDDLARYRANPPSSWTGIEVVWARRLETLLDERCSGVSQPEEPT